MTTQDKFMQAMRKLVEERDEIELIVEPGYSNTGEIRFEVEGRFTAPILVFPYSFNGSSGNFSDCRTEPLGRNDKGGVFSHTEGAEFAKVIERVEEILDGDREPGETDEDKANHRAAVRQRQGGRS